MAGICASGQTRRARESASELHDRLQRLAIALNCFASELHDRLQRLAIELNCFASELHDRLQRLAIELNRWAVVQLT